MQRNLIITDDGSATLYHSTLGEHYHSTHGAIQESSHIFIEAALSQRIDRSEVVIFEVGFGTGLNAFLTLHATFDHSIQIDYRSIELFPLTELEVASLNYDRLLLGSNKGIPTLEELHRTPWGTPHPITPHFSLTKFHANFIDFIPPTGIDLVFFDAFSPEKNPELWSIDRFRALFEAMNPQGILTTYCAKGVVRRALTEVGFRVERLPGPPGKREILRATKP